MNELSERWCRSVPSLRDASLRAGFVRSELAREATDEVADALNDLCARAEQAEPLAREVLAPFITALTGAGFSPLADELRGHATERALLPLGRLLRKKARPAATATAPVPDPNERPVLPTAGGRVLTLGERKALARKPSRAALDKLLRDPHPVVIRHVLDNTRVTEDDVVRLAARRPAFADVIAEIARHPGWTARPRVRMALVQNPGTPPEISVPLVRLLIRPELLQVIAAADVPPIVRAAATELLERRPPVPVKDGGRGPAQ
jgi:hypothetical protein